MADDKMRLDVGDETKSANLLSMEVARRLLLLKGDDRKEALKMLEQLRNNQVANAISADFAEPLALAEFEKNQTAFKEKEDKFMDLVQVPAEVRKEIEINAKESHPFDPDRPQKKEFYDNVSTHYGDVNDFIKGVVLDKGTYSQKRLDAAKNNVGDLIEFEKSLYGESKKQDGHFWQLGKMLDRNKQALMHEIRGDTEADQSNRKMFINKIAGVKSGEPDADEREEVAKKYPTENDESYVHYNRAIMVRDVLQSVETNKGRDLSAADKADDRTKDTADTGKSAPKPAAEKSETAKETASGDPKPGDIDAWIFAYTQDNLGKDGKSPAQVKADAIEMASDAVFSKAQVDAALKAPVDAARQADFREKLAKTLKGDKPYNSAEIDAAVTAYYTSDNKLQSEIKSIAGAGTKTDAEIAKLETVRDAPTQNGKFTVADKGQFGREAKQDNLPVIAVAKDGPIKVGDAVEITANGKTVKALAVAEIQGENKSGSAAVLSQGLASQLGVQYKTDANGVAISGDAQLDYKVTAHNVPEKNFPIVAESFKSNNPDIPLSDVAQKGFAQQLQALPPEKKAQAFAALEKFGGRIINRNADDDRQSYADLQTSLAEQGVQLPEASEGRFFDSKVSLDYVSELNAVAQKASGVSNNDIASIADKLQKVAAAAKDSGDTHVNDSTVAIETKKLNSVDPTAITYAPADEPAKDVATR